MVSRTGSGYRLTGARQPMDWTSPEFDESCWGELIEARIPRHLESHVFDLPRHEIRDIRISAWAPCWLRPAIKSRAHAR